jgi:hypothetical protein
MDSWLLISDYGQIGEQQLVDRLEADATNLQGMRR